jgi:hypothetical protein
LALRDLVYDGAVALVPLLKTVSSDPRTWKDPGWLGLISIVGMALGFAAITFAGFVLAYLTMPVWYWAVSDPHDQYALTNLGLDTVDTFGEAVALAAIGLVLAPLALLLARACAAMHAALVEEATDEA